MADLERFHKLPLVLLDKMDLTGLHILTIIDPTGGSEKESSELGIFSAIRLRDCSWVIVGLASRNIRQTDDMQQFLVDYFAGFRRVGKLARMPHYVAVENNFGGSPYAAHHVMYAKRGLPHVREWTRDPRSRLSGVRTDEKLKNRAVLHVASDLAMDRVRFAREMIVAAPDSVDQSAEARPEEMRRTLYLQLCSTRRVAAGTRDGETKFRITGKRPSVGLVDDMMMAMMIYSQVSLEVIQSEVVAQSGDDDRSLRPAGNQSSSLDY